MGRPAAFHPVRRGAGDTLRARLESAPEKHGDAILAACEILQELHDRGVLEVIRGGLVASDELLQMAVDSANTPDAVRAIRNLLYWRSVLGRIEPEWFQGIFQAIPDGLAVATAQRDEPISLWRVLRRALRKDSLRGLTAAVDFLESLGRHLNTLEHGVPATRPVSRAE